MSKRKGGSTTGGLPAAWDGKEVAGLAAAAAAVPPAALAALRVGEEAVRVGNPNRPAYMQPGGPLDGPGDRAGRWASGWAGRQQRMLGQAHPHGLDGPRGGTGLPAARGPCRCKPAGPGHEAMQAGPVAQFLFIYFIFFLFLFRHFQQFIFQFMDISLC
jgi:hypothetical protein